MKRIPLLALVVFLQVPTFLLQAEDIISGLGGFEEPVVKARTPGEKGGDPSLHGEHGLLFASFSLRTGTRQGTLSAGMTNEIAHSGTQSLFIEAEKFAARYEGAGLQTNPIPVLPEHVYSISIWGKMDSKRPFLLKDRPVYVKMQTDFLEKDKTTQTGDAVYLLQPIPGTPNRDVFFNDKTWTELATEFTPPPEAAYAVVTWRWETGSEPGEASGKIFFDDFTIKGDLPPQTLLQAVQAAESGTSAEIAPAQPEKAETLEKIETPEKVPTPEQVAAPKAKTEKN